jgi:hypothetical protein
MIRHTTTTSTIITTATTTTTTNNNNNNNNNTKLVLKWMATDTMAPAQFPARAIKYFLHDICGAFEDSYS